MENFIIGAFTSIDSRRVRKRLRKFYAERRRDQERLRYLLDKNEFSPGKWLPTANTRGLEAYPIIKSAEKCGYVSTLKAREAIALKRVVTKTDGHFVHNYYANGASQKKRKKRAAFLDNWRIKNSGSCIIRSDDRDYSHFYNHVRVLQEGPSGK